MSLRPVLTMVPAWLWLLCLSVPQVSWAPLTASDPGFGDWHPRSPLHLDQLHRPWVAVAGGRGAELALSLLWDHEGGFISRSREQAEIPLPVRSQCHGRKTEPGDKTKIFPQALPKAQSAELYVEVPENYGGNFPLYLTKVGCLLFFLWLTPENPDSGKYAI